MILLKIYTDSPKKTIDFYQKVFGWEINKWHGPGDTWLIKDKTSYLGALTKPDTQTKNYSDLNFSSTIVVDNYDLVLKKIISIGWIICTTGAFLARFGSGTESLFTIVDRG